jgi:hypothetical protein
MSDDELEGQEPQSFFEHTVRLGEPPDRPPGRFIFKKRSARPGRLVLFQYDKQIVASAFLRKVCRNCVGTPEGYGGFLELDPESVRWLSSPITHLEFTQRTGKKFSQAMHHLDADEEWFTRRLGYDDALRSG